MDYLTKKVCAKSFPPFVCQALNHVYDVSNICRFYESYTEMIKEKCKHCIRLKVESDKKLNTPEEIIPKPNESQVVKPIPAEKFQLPRTMDDLEKPKLPRNDDSEKPQKDDPEKMTVSVDDDDIEIIEKPVPAVEPGLRVKCTHVSLNTSLCPDIGQCSIKGCPAAHSINSILNLRYCMDFLRTGCSKPYCFPHYTPAQLQAAYILTLKEAVLDCKKCSFNCKLFNPMDRRYRQDRICYKEYTASCRKKSECNFIHFTEVQHLKMPPPCKTFALKESCPRRGLEKGVVHLTHQKYQYNFLGILKKNLQKCSLCQDELKNEWRLFRENLEKCDSPVRVEPVSSETPLPGLSEESKAKDGELQDDSSTANNPRPASHSNVSDEACNKEEIGDSAGLSSKEVKSQPGDNLLNGIHQQNLQQPSPGIHQQEEPSPVIHRREEPSPGKHKQEEPAPGIHNQEEPSPGIQKQVEPSPGIHKQVEPSPGKYQQNLQLPFPGIKPQKVQQPFPVIPQKSVDTEPTSKDPSTNLSEQEIISSTTPPSTTPPSSIPPSTTLQSSTPSTTPPKSTSSTPIPPSTTPQTSTPSSSTPQPAPHYPTGKLPSNTSLIPQKGKTLTDDQNPPQQKFLSTGGTLQGKTTTLPNEKSTFLPNERSNFLANEKSAPLPNEKSTPLLYSVSTPNQPSMSVNVSPSLNAKAISSSSRLSSAPPSTSAPTPQLSSGRFPPQPSSSGRPPYSGLNLPQSTVKTPQNSYQSRELSRYPPERLSGAHPSYPSHEESRKRKICPIYGNVSNKCRRGTNCWDLHDMSSIPCRYWLAGYCSHGSRCKLKH